MHALANDLSLLPDSDKPGQELMDEAELDVSISFGMDFVTRYIARGVVFSNQPSLQPWIEINAPFGPGPAEKHDIRWRIGSWNSLHPGDTGEGRPLGLVRRRLNNWYEADLYGGLLFDLDAHVSASLTYFVYLSPAGSFDDIHELDLRMFFDDSWIWEDSLPGFSLNPAFRFSHELLNEAGRERWYFSPSLTPTYHFAQLPLDLTARIPLALGFAGRGWYRDADGNDLTFGFFQTGLRLSTPVEIFETTVNLTGGVDVYVVPDETINATGRNVDVVGRIGFSTSF